MKEKGDRVGGDVHLAPGIAVVPPGPAGAVGLLEDREGVDAGGLQLDGGRDSGEAAADDRHPRRVPAGPWWATPNGERSDR